MLLGQAFFLANITSSDIHVTAEMNIIHLATNKALLYCILLYKSNRMSVSVFGCLFPNSSETAEK